MQHLMKLLERDQYIHWHRIKDEDMVRNIFWCHPDAVKLVNACNLVFLIDNTYKTNRYRLPLFDFVGVTPTGMTFSTGLHMWSVNALIIWSGIYNSSEAFLKSVMPSLELLSLTEIKH